MIRAVFRGTGSYLPEKILTNADLATMVDTSDEWITKRSGIKQRHIAADDQATSDMAVEAAKKAMSAGGVHSSEIDAVIVATTTPDTTFPSVAVKVQAALGIPVCMAFDVQAVCTGFVYAISVANSLIVSGQVKRALVIGAEKMSSLLNWKDRSTCVLFGDGAGAVLLEAQDGNGDMSDRGIFATQVYANGTQSDLLYTDGGVSTTGTTGQIVMAGREVFKYAVQYMSDAVHNVLKETGLSSSDIDWLVPHQANIRILEATAQKLNFPMDRVILTLEKHGNTSAASIPLALDHAVRSNSVKPGDLILIEGMGGGLTWGASVARF